MGKQVHGLDPQRLVCRVLRLVESPKTVRSPGQLDRSGRADKKLVNDTIARMCERAAGGTGPASADRGRVGGNGISEAGPERRRQRAAKWARLPPEHLETG